MPLPAPPACLPRFCGWRPLPQLHGGAGCPGMHCMHAACRHRSACARPGPHPVRRYNARPENGGQRVATVLMYLATPEEGGETVFPYAEKKVGRREGRGRAGAPGLERRGALPLTPFSPRSPAPVVGLPLLQRLPIDASLGSPPARWRARGGAIVRGAAWRSRPSRATPCSSTRSSQTARRTRPPRTAPAPRWRERSGAQPGGAGQLGGGCAGLGRQGLWALRGSAGHGRPGAGLLSEHRCPRQGPSLQPWLPWWHACMAVGGSAALVAVYWKWGA